MKLKNASKIICVLLLASGCSSFSGAPKPIADVDDEIEAITTAFSTERITNIYTTAVDGDSISRAARNELILARMYAIDLRYREFEKDLSQEARNSNFLLKLTSLGLTGAAALISVSTTQAILAGVDTGLKGATEAFNKDVLVDRTVQILTNQMRAGRSAKRISIMDGLTKDLNGYPMFLALSEVEEYYAAGTLYGALAGVNETVAAKAETNAKKAAEATTNFTIKLDRKEVRQTQDAEALTATINNTTGGAAKAKACFDALSDEHFNAEASEGKPRNYSDLLEFDQDHPEAFKKFEECFNKPA